MLGKRLKNASKLYGLCLEKYGIACHALLYLKADLDKIKQEIISRLPPVVDAAAKISPLAPLVFSQTAQSALEAAIQEAIGLQHGYVGTEHLLMGLISIKDENLDKIWSAFNLTPEMVRKEICELMGIPSDRAIC